MSKKCTKCGKEKELEEFYNYKNGKRSHCIECHKENNRIYKEKNNDKIKKHYEENKEYYSSKGKKRRENNKEEISKNFKIYYQEHKEYFKEHRKKYYQSEKGKKKKLEWCNKYNSKNKHVVLWRSLLRRTIVQLKQEKNGSTFDMLGYTALELKEHIEKNWLEGMNWDNYGDWHVDHIKCVSSFSPDTPAMVVNALSNLRPMWATTRIINGEIYEGNLNKGKK